eukprot:11729607-Alexandrium_andersonii.AAC.1
MDNRWPAAGPTCPQLNRTLTVGPTATRLPRLPPAASGYNLRARTRTHTHTLVGPLIYACMFA